MTAQTKLTTASCGTHARMSSACSPEGSPRAACPLASWGGLGAAVHRLPWLQRGPISSWLETDSGFDNPRPSRLLPVWLLLGSGACMSGSAPPLPRLAGVTAGVRAAQRGSSSTLGTCVSGSGSCDCWLSVQGVCDAPCRSCDGAGRAASSDQLTRQPWLLRA